MQKVLKQVGIKTISTKSELKIYGKGIIDASNKTITIQKGIHDHRIHMASFVLSLLTGSATNFKGFETVFTSSPSFLKIMKSLEQVLKLKNKNLKITCDGGAATGKTTGAKMIAKKYKLSFLSSGLLYRYASYLILKQRPKNKILFLKKSLKD